MTAADNRLFVEAVVYRYRAGIPWRDLPECFGDWKNVHRRHSRWAASGVWARVFEHLAVDANNGYAMIDSTIVDALGNPLVFYLTGREAHDLAGADAFQGNRLKAHQADCRSKVSR